MVRTDHSEARKYVERIVLTMKPGQCVQIDRDVFESAYRCGWPSIYETPRQAFLSSQVGSGWGAVTCRAPDHVLNQHYYTIGKHEEGPRRVYVDPDRESWFTKLPTGEYVPRAATPPSTEQSPAP